MGGIRDGGGALNEGADMDAGPVGGAIGMDGGAAPIEGAKEGCIEVLGGP